MTGTSCITGAASAAFFAASRSLISMALVSLNWRCMSLKADCNFAFSWFFASSKSACKFSTLKYRAKVFLYLVKKIGSNYQQSFNFFRTVSIKWSTSHCHPLSLPSICMRLSANLIASKHRHCTQAHPYINWSDTSWKRIKKFIRKLDYFLALLLLLFHTYTSWRTRSTKSNSDAILRRW